MATVTLQGHQVHTCGTLPAVGAAAPDFSLVNSSLETVSLDNFNGKRVVLNIFPSLDTGVCAASVRRFNQLAAGMENTVVLAISKDLPFAHARFCAAEGIDNVVTLSAFRNTRFGEEYGVLITDSPMAGLFARAVVVLNENRALGPTQYTLVCSHCGATVELTKGDTARCPYCGSVLSDPGKH